jgi:polyisoprenoid-binding protein YceI
MSENETSGVRYRLDPDQSDFTVQAFATGLLAGFGHNPTIGIRAFKGGVQLTRDEGANTLSDASLQLSVQAKSLVVLDEVKEKDRREIEQTMFNEALEVDRYPEIIFQSTQITSTRVTDNRYKARIIGNLTLHGVTRSGVWITAQIILDGDTLVAKGDFTIKQTDYNIKLVSVAAGALKLKDELKFTFNLVGHREKA